MTFLYIFEDGTYGVSPNGPTDGDLLAVQDGLLTVLHSDSEIKEFDENGVSVDIPTVTIKQYPDTTEKYHAF